MEKFKVSFEANNQQLKSIGTKHASDTYADIEATFVLGEKWTDMDSVSAVWWNDFTRVATVLDSQGKCIVPHEVLTRKGCVRVNLVGSIVEGDELITRLTSYSAEAVQVNEKIKLTGSETSELTPSQFEQFVTEVKADADRAEAGATASANSADEAEASAQNASESASASAVSASDSARSATASAGYAQNASESAQSAENAKDDAEDARDEILGMRATAETLEAGSDATASYSDGLLTLGIPRGDQGIQGIQGETGATPNLTIGTVETLEPTEDATASITGTAENPVLNLGLPKGDTGEVSLEDLGALLPTDTASGDIASITDGQSVVPVKSLKVTLEPIQDLHGYDKPWSGGAGKNLFGYTLADFDNGTAYASGTFIAVDAKAGTYTMSTDAPTGYIWFGLVASRIGEGTQRVYSGNSQTFTLTEDGQLAIGIATASKETALSYKTQLEKGSTATSFEPYTNICPISGHTEVVTHRTGVNVWDEEWEVGYINDNGEEMPSNIRWRSKNYIITSPNMTYYAYAGSNKYVYIRFYTADGSFISLVNVRNTTFTTPQNAYKMRFCVGSEYGNTYNHDISINYPSTDHEYHAYNGQSYTTTLGRTVYGGTLDVVSGELVVDRAYADFDGSSDESWTLQSINSYGIANFYYRLENATDADGAICNEFNRQYSLIGATTDEGFLLNSNGVFYVRIESTKASTVSEFKTWLSSNPLQLVYELSTPQTYQLDPQTIDLLLGDNNVWTDCGSVEVTYKADVGLYIDKKLN